MKCLLSRANAHVLPLSGLCCLISWNLSQQIAVGIIKCKPGELKYLQALERRVCCISNTLFDFHWTTVSWIQIKCVQGQSNKMPRYFNSKSNQGTLLLHLYLIINDDYLIIIVVIRTVSGIVARSSLVSWRVLIVILLLRFNIITCLKK